MLPVQSSNSLSHNEDHTTKIWTLINRDTFTCAAHGNHTTRNDDSTAGESDHLTVHMRGIISEENKTEMISFSYGAQNPEFKCSSAVTGRERERESVFLVVLRVSRSTVFMRVWRRLF